MNLSRSVKRSEIDLLEIKVILEARRSFYAFRRYMRPNLKVNWYVFDVCYNLQKFFEDFEAGKKPALGISAPPQHGKSLAVIDFIAWMSGKNPDRKSIYTSFSDRLGVRANLHLQRIFDSSKYKKVFPDFKIKSLGDKSLLTAVRNSELIEFVGKDGYFRNTTVRGSITGESLDLGIIDDPVKGREAANSETIRNSTWEWLVDDFFTRFSEEAGLLWIMTRWHIDDPMSRMMKEMGDQFKVICYPAIANNDEKFRLEGEPLFPELKSLQFLTTRKSTMSAASWAALYQQSPITIGGSIIKPSWFKRYSIAPRLKSRYIYADTAMKTKECNDYSVFQCWGEGIDGGIYLLDQIRDKWEAPDLRRNAINFWLKHKALDSFEMGALRKMKVEDKASGTGLIQELKSQRDNKIAIPIDPIERVIDKYTRVNDVLGYIESGYVYIPEAAPFVSDFLKECEEFTADDSHMYDDQIDPMVDAINDLVVKGSTLSVWSKLAK